MAEVVKTLIEWLKTLPPKSKVFVDEDGMTLYCTNDDEYYELGGEPDGEEEDDDDEEE